MRSQSVINSRQRLFQTIYPILLYVRFLNNWPIPDSLMIKLQPEYNSSRWSVGYWDSIKWFDLEKYHPVQLKVFQIQLEIPKTQKRESLYNKLLSLLLVRNSFVCMSGWDDEVGQTISIDDRTCFNIIDQEILVIVSNVCVSNRFDVHHSENVQSKNRSTCFADAICASQQENL